MEISLEKIIEIVTKEVIKELSQNGFLNVNTSPAACTRKKQNRSVEIDMSEFKTPVLTENNLAFLDKDVNKIVIPGNTVISPGAHDIIKRKTLTIIYKNQK